MRFLQVFRSYNTTSYLSVSYGIVLNTKSLIKQSAVMNKLLNKPKKKKKFTTGGVDELNSVNQSGILEMHKNKSSVKRRTQVLNKLFMKYITDIMATSSASIDLLDFNIEITQVAVSDDYKALRVYWYNRGMSLTNDQIEEKLQESTKYLRHELSQLRLIPNIPHIVFVKDKRQVLMNEVEDLLKTADMGVASSDSEIEVKHEDRLLSPMSTNIFGLNRAKILEKIKRDIKKYSTKLTPRQPEPNSQPQFNYRYLIKKFVNKDG